nr:MAG TPA: hypothetical protein [Caudoviricetes sp.]
MVFFVAKKQGVWDSLNAGARGSLVLREFLADKGFENLGH